MRRYILTNRQQCDLALIMNGGFAPLQTFMDEQTYSSVLDTSRLPKGSLFPIPIVLDIPQTNLPSLHEDVLLTDHFNVPLAKMRVSSVFQLNKSKEANAVYGTKNLEHFGVRYLFKITHDYAISGKISVINSMRFFSFLKYRHTPTELKIHFAKKGYKKIVAFQTRNPIHKAHFELLKEAAKKTGAHVLVHPVVGETKDGDISSVTRIKSYIALYEKRMRTWATLSLLPLAMRMAGPKEAMFHAIIRKNYGATHFIIGRDHAGPGKTKKGIPFYGPYDAQQYVKQHEKELGIEILSFHEMVYLPKLKKYVEATESIKPSSYRSISGTQVRDLLKNNKTLPTWFTFPETARCLIEEHKREHPGGLVIFFTGLPSSGKSTLAQMLYQYILEHSNLSVSLLDGDIVRHNLSKGLGFSREDRNENILRIGYVASEIARHSGIAICSAIAPYETSRQQNRELINRFGAYFQIYISTPLQECMKRDVKGLYQAYTEKKITNLSGLDSLYEIPQQSELVIDTSKLSEKQSLNTILRALKQRRLLSI